MKLGLICRCKDEYFIAEFVQYYLNEGVDFIYIIDDNSEDKSIYNHLLNNRRVRVIFEKNILTTNYVSKLYKRIKKKYDWLIYVDADEFITTKKNSSKTIREELLTTFKDVHCIKIPWVMMSCNGKEKSPKSVLSNVYRWNHDLKHENEFSKHTKFRCRYAEIEVKCIFKPAYFDDIWDHYPKNPTLNHELKVTESIQNKSCERNPFYKNLREQDIETGYLLCYHYRIISKENCIQKLKTNHWYSNVGFTIADLMSTDYPEVKDETLYQKTRLYSLVDLNTKPKVKKWTKLFSWVKK